MKKMRIFSCMCRASSEVQMFNGGVGVYTSQVQNIIVTVVEVQYVYSSDIYEHHI